LFSKRYIFMTWCLGKHRDFTFTFYVCANQYEVLTFTQLDMVYIYIPSTETCFKLSVICRPFKIILCYITITSCVIVHEHHYCTQWNGSTQFSLTIYFARTSTNEYWTAWRSPEIRNIWLKS